MDGLRYGRSPPRQGSALTLFLEPEREPKASAKALPLARLRPPASLRYFQRNYAGLRDHDRTIGLERRFPRSVAPLHAPIEHRHPLTFYPDSERLKRSRPVFSYLPEGLPVLRCAAARLGRLQSLPVRPDHSAYQGNNS